MAQSSINVRVDDNLKHQFEQFCDDIGLTMSSAITVFMKRAVREQRIPFEIAADPFYSEENIQYLLRGLKALNEGRVTEHELIMVDDDEG